jgi:hypothetical protein
MRNRVVVSQQDTVEQGSRKVSLHARCTGLDDFLRIHGGRKCLQANFQAISKGRLRERAEKSTAEVLTEYDDRCSNCSLTDRQRILDCYHWLFFGLLVSNAILCNPKIMV